MKISIVTAVLDSPEVVRRHVLHYKSMPLPADVEWIVVDDKSDPPLSQDDYDFPQMKILQHRRKGIWTQPAARNFGVKHATGDVLICTDIDHIITIDLINFARDTVYDFVKLQREVAILDEQGQFAQTAMAVKVYGFEKSRFDKGGFHITPHTNSFIINRELYVSLGGVSERRVKLGKHPNREEVPLRKRLFHLKNNGEITILDEKSDTPRPMIYMIPNGRYCGHKDYNPFGLFHDLERKTR
ncbi:MAG: glycosyltransferase family 2 protein [Gammaproteobacteria bacterium]|nr:glycosyltransferase family 2 protein [Gammaproteobacteria bacterium]